VFTPTIDKIKFVCLQHKVFSSFFSSKKLSVIFHNNIKSFFSSAGIILCAVTPFSLAFLSSINSIILASGTILAVLVQKYFLNLSNFSVEQLFKLLTQDINKVNFIYCLFFVISNFFFWIFLTFNVTNLLMQSG